MGKVAGYFTLFCVFTLVLGLKSQDECGDRYHECSGDNPSCCTGLECHGPEIYPFYSCHRPDCRDLFQSCSEDAPCCEDSGLVCIEKGYCTYGKFDISLVTS